jgi:hypothetical protein
MDELEIHDAVYTVEQQCTLIIRGSWNGMSCTLP